VLDQALHDQCGRLAEPVAGEDSLGLRLGDQKLVLVRVRDTARDTAVLGAGVEEGERIVAP
jgi:hypothetical protein